MGQVIEALKMTSENISGFQVPSDQIFEGWPIPKPWKLESALKFDQNRPTSIGFSSFIMTLHGTSTGPKYDKNPKKKNWENRSHPLINMVLIFCNLDDSRGDLRHHHIFMTH